MFILSSPLEQFQILPLIPVRLGDFDISFTNASLIIILGLLLTVFVMFLLMENDTSAQIVPNRYQVFLKLFMK
jgi:F0F1-type ATP synthase membrane subunit a